MQTKMKVARLVATCAIVLAGGLIATTGFAGAQSVPIGQPATTTNPPAQPAQPPRSPVEPPSNGGNVGGAGAARLPSTGSAGAGSGNGTAPIALSVLALVLGAGGVASWRLGRRVR